MKKLLLLVFSMTLVLFFTSDAFAQKGMVKVANNNELIQALDDPSVKSIQITEAGFYDEILLNAKKGTIVVKGEGGSRATCQYWIQPADVCFDPDNQPGGITAGFVVDTAKAGTTDQGDGDCPPINTGTWSVIVSPPFSTVNFLAAANMETMPFEGDMAGLYSLQYEWSITEKVQQDYFFYSIPEITDLHANPDTVCGLSTTITFDYDFGTMAGDTTVTWTVNGADSSAVFPYMPGTFGFAVTQCGSYEVTLHVENSHLGCTEDDSTIFLYFYDDPIANAGTDDSICGLVYDGLNGTYTGATCDAGTDPVESWSYLSGPDPSPVFSAGLDSVTVTICGAYQFTYTVTNGLCVDSDVVDIYFYDTPVLDALVNDSVCGLNAPLAGGYTVGCDNGVTPVESWSQISGPGTATFNGLTDVDVDVCGSYEFQYKVVNGLCADSSTVFYYFFDTPVVDAGPNDDVCGTTYTLQPTYTYDCDAGGAPVESWSMVSGPAGAVAGFVGNVVTVDSCGLYVFQYKVENGLCADSATVEITFYDTPVITMPEDDTVCGLTTSLSASHTVKCGTPTVLWTKVSGPGVVSFTPDNTDDTDVDVDTCGTYVFKYEVTNGPCTAFGEVTVDFVMPPEIFTQGVPDQVCGFDSFFDVWYTTDCPINDSGYWLTVPPQATITTNGGNSWQVHVDTCGTFDFTFRAVNGPCFTDSTISITFYETPDPEIVGDTLVYTCSTVEYCALDMGSCNDLADLTFEWTVAGGTFDGGATIVTNTGDNCIDVHWDQWWSYGPGQLTVAIWITGLEECGGDTTIDIYKQRPTLEGQIKYWNQFETYMPTPYATDDYQTIPFDYFYVTLYRIPFLPADGPMMGGDSITTVFVQPRLMEDLNELMSYFDFILDTEYGEDEFACEAEYYLKVWDGGLIYHTSPPPPDEETKLGGSTYTYNNWGGVNATDALAIQLMVGAANEINGAPWNYSWVGLTSMSPWYGYYSHGIADVNSSDTYVNGGITALDALTAKYRAVGLLGSYPHNGAGMNQFSPNFRVTGRMVDSLPQMTWDTPFDTPNIPDVQFWHSGADYMYFSYATAHKYTSDGLPWEGDANYINLYYESIGDINASYVPPGSGLKAEPTVELTYEGMFNAYIGEELTIPVNIDRDAEVGAITLSFNYRSDLIEVLGTNYADDDMFINQEEGILNMAWFNTEAIEYIADAAVAQIRIRILEEIPEGTELFSLNVNTELADATANPIDVDLKTIGINTDGISSAELTSSNYPNPFNDATTISYILPESGSVKIDVYNNMGMLVATLIDEVQDSGVQNVVFNSSDAQAGVYFYHITVQGETKNYSAVKRMIVVN